tara:strand:+ start:1157 stop:1516 length:360 start_codon:yes stop_codon:yes gene_type:complete
MTYLTGEVTVIHTNTQADFENFTYSAIYANANGTYTINGASVTMVIGDTLEVVVEAPPETVLNAGYILLGNPNAPQTDYKTGLISATTENFQNNIGLVETYQFVDIKTGNPAISNNKLT